MILALDFLANLTVSLINLSLTSKMIIVLHKRLNFKANDLPKPLAPPVINTISLSILLNRHRLGTIK